MITCFVDGACEPNNPGGHGACAMIAFEGPVMGGKDAPRPAPIVQSALIIGHGPDMTNNVAEWRALRGALKWFKSRADKYANEEIIICLDSQLVACQFSGEFACNAEDLIPLRDECRDLAKAFSRLELMWVPREDNWVADDLINQLYSKRNIRVRVRTKKPRRDLDEDLARL
jgi:ribonuclease HI